MIAAPAQSRLAFDPEAHVYTWDGAPLQSVTETIGKAGLIDDQWFTEFARTRGSRVHAMIADYENDLLAVEDVHDYWRPWLMGWIRFKAETGWETLAVEEKLADPLTGFAGTIDALGALRRREAILDIKTGGREAWWPLQLAAYRHLARANGIANPRKLFNLQLTPDGNYFIREIPAGLRVEDIEVDFLAMLRCQRRRGLYQ